jgi:hypothetical protein
MFCYKMYLFTYPGSNLRSGSSDSTLCIYLNDKKIGNYYSKYRIESRSYTLEFENDKCSGIDLSLCSICNKIYDLKLENELTDEMLQFDKVTGLYGFIEYSKLPHPVAKFAGRKK